MISEELPGQARYAGRNCKGSLKRAFQEKQPWSYKVDLFKSEERQAQDINLLDSKSTLDLRKQLIEQVRAETDTRQLQPGEGELVEVDSNNKTYDMLKMKTLEVNEGKDHEYHAPLLPPVSSAAPEAPVGQRTRRKAQPPSLVSFKHFYDLQNQKLEIQKQSLIKL